MKKDFIKSIVDKHAQSKTQELREHLQDVVRQVSDDQRRWLDEMMKDLLPPHLYESGLRGSNLNEIGAYLRKHNICVTFIPDSLSIRIMIGDQIHSQFLANLTLDDQPLSKTIEASTNLN